MEHINQKSPAEEVGKGLNFVQSKDTKNTGIAPDFEDLQNPNTFVDHLNNIYNNTTETPKYLFDRSKIYVKPPLALSYNNEAFGTLGNFSMIIGKAKAKKTFLISMITAAALEETPINGFKNELQHNKKGILYFDTEQGDFHINTIDKRIAAIRNKSSNSFEIHALRRASTDERLSYIEKHIDEYCNNKDPETNDLGIVIIDGIRDLIKDINSPDEATNISDKLLQITADYHIHIIVVLHQNKGNEHARGHIGTELQNKAETVASVNLDSSDKSISIVDAELTRNKPFETFAFTIGENNLPYITSIPVSESNRKKGIEPGDIPSPELDRVIIKAFEHTETHTASSLNDFFRVEFNIGGSKSRKFVAYCNAQGKIKNTSRSSTKHTYMINI